MHKYLLESALTAAREMIQAYCVDRNVEGVFKHLDSDKFNFMGFTEGNVFNSSKKFREYAESSLGYTLAYKLVEENYSVACESRDSCLVIAKTKLLDTRVQKISALNYFFYFNRLGNKMVCSHYHVSRLFKPPQVIKSMFFNENMPQLYLPSEIISYNEDLLDFINSTEVAEKSFYYEENLPYRFVNINFMKLLGYSKIHDFAPKQNHSSLMNVHVADQNRYVEYLKAQFTEKVDEHASERHQYLSSYYLSYRLQSPFLSEEVTVLEWGNFFKQNGRTIVNCFVLNLNEVEKISLKTKSDVTLPNNSILTDCGIHISPNVIVYPLSRQIKINDTTVSLTPVENEIFLVLLDNLNQPILPEKIYSSIWRNEEINLTSNVLAMHISNIRRKLSSHENSIKLVFIRHKGYCLRV